MAEPHSKRVLSLLRVLAEAGLTENGGALLLCTHIREPESVLAAELSTHYSCNLIVTMALQRLTTYLKSARFKRRLYTCSMLGLMGLFAYELATFNKPLFGGRRAETSGYDGYYDE